MYKDVVGFEEFYEVNEYGDVYSKRTNKLMTRNSVDRDGYEVLKFRVCGKAYTVKRHRIVAQAFIPNPFNKPTVNHLDGNHRNNDVSNLEWATQSEQQLHAISIGLRKDCLNRVCVEQYKDNILIAVHESLKAAEKVTGIKWQGISKCINGKRNSAGGCTWKRR